MIADFLLPDLGEGLPEAEIVQWHVSEGDEVTLNQTIAEVETAKAVVEIPSPYTGIVRVMHAVAGDVVAVGSPLVSFAVDGEGGDPPAESGADAPVPAGATRRVADDLRTTARQTRASGDPEPMTPHLVGYGAAAPSANRPRRRARTTVELPRERPRSTPPVRKLAKDLGVDLVLVAATHPGETITREHVEQFAARRAVSEPPSTVPPATTSRARTTRTPVRGVRKHTAAAMVRSAFTAPHATTFLTVDVTATVELLASLKTDRALDGHRVGVLAIVAKAVCLALGRTPALNARWDDETGEIVQHHYVTLGIAAATDRGLVVPVIADADGLTLVALADAIADLAVTARAGRTAPAAMTGGTFSITNVGVFGMDAGTPLLNPGESGILAVGAVRRAPWEHAGEIALREVLTLSLSFDHRVVDGAEAARFLTDVAGVLREPGRAMLMR